MKVEECEGGVGGRSERVVWEGGVGGKSERVVWGGVRGWCKLHVYMYISDLSHPLFPSLLPPPLPPSSFLPPSFLLSSPLPPPLPPSSSPPSFLLPSLPPPPLLPSSSPPSLLQALSEALLQVRADLVETTQKTLEGRARQEQQDANVQQLVDKKTSELQVCDILERCL